MLVLRRRWAAAACSECRQQWLQFIGRTGCSLSRDSVSAGVTGSIRLLCWASSCHLQLTTHTHSFPTMTRSLYQNHNLIRLTPTADGGGSDKIACFITKKWISSHRCRLSILTLNLIVAWKKAFFKEVCLTLASLFKSPSEVFTHCHIISQVNGMNLRPGR